MKYMTSRGEDIEGLGSCDRVSDLNDLQEEYPAAKLVIAFPEGEPELWIVDCEVTDIETALTLYYMNEFKWDIDGIPYFTFNPDLNEYSNPTVIQ